VPSIRGRYPRAIRTSFTWLNTGSRGIPGCASCHGAHAGGPIETPTLAGQRQEYLLSQLTAFAKGDRHNDIYNRMRGIAAKLRKDEIEKLAEYYAAVRLFRSQD
jgi:cytochrome c553